MQPAAKSRAIGSNRIPPSSTLWTSSRRAVSVVPRRSSSRRRPSILFVAGMNGSVGVPNVYASLNAKTNQRYAPL